MTLPGTALGGVANGANPLVVVVPAFTTKAIGQSTNAAGHTNTITVTLQPNIPLAVGDTVTISALTNAVATNGNGLALTGADKAKFKDGANPPVPSKGTWDNTNKKLTLTVNSALDAGTSYVIAFDVTNPAATQSAAAPSIAATVAAGANIAASAMDQATGNSAALAVAEPANYFAIGQSNPVAGAGSGGTTANTMTVTMVLAADLKTGDAVTISDLKGADTADADLALNGAAKAKFKKAGGNAELGVWVKAAGTLTMELAGDLDKGTQYVFTFPLTNPAAAPTAPTPRIEASVAANSAGTAVTEVAMTLPGTALGGVANGANPLVVVVPAFTTKAIGQSTPLVGATNTITVTLQPNIPLAVGDTVTISALTGAVATDGNGLALTGADKAKFKDGANTPVPSKGTWDSTAKKLTLTVNSALDAGTSYVVAFDVTNPAVIQNAPTVQIAATVAAGANIAASAMVQATGNSAALAVAEPANYFAIGQSNPVADAATATGATNTITVTIISAVNMVATDTVTISGLTGTGTSTTATNLALTDASGGSNDNQKFETAAGTANNGDWVANTGTLTLKVKASTTV